MSAAHASPESNPSRHPAQALVEDLVARSKIAMRSEISQRLDEGMHIVDASTFSGFIFVGERQPTSLFGFKALQLIKKDVTDRAFEELIINKRTDSDLNDEIAGMQAFVLEMRGYAKAQDLIGEQLFVFFSPDSPPTVAFGADIEYVTGHPAHTADLDFSALQQVAAAFGDEAVHPLDDFECQELLSVCSKYELKVDF